MSVIEFPQKGDASKDNKQEVLIKTVKDYLSELSDEEIVKMKNTLIPIEAKLNNQFSNENIISREENTSYILDKVKNIPIETLKMIMGIDETYAMPNQQWDVMDKKEASSENLLKIGRMEQASKRLDNILGSAKEFVHEIRQQYNESYLATKKKISQLFERFPNIFRSISIDGLDEYNKAAQDNFSKDFVTYNSWHREIRKLLSSSADFLSIKDIDIIDNLIEEISQNVDLIKNSQQETMRSTETKFDNLLSGLEARVKE